MSRRGYGELSLGDMCFEKGGIPQLLDIIAVPLRDHAPHLFQTENYLVDHARQWRKSGRLDASPLANLCDPVASLWINGCHSYNGQNDRVPQAAAEKEAAHSLVLIKPQLLGFRVQQIKSKREVRAEFGFHGDHYRLKVTHPEVEDQYVMRKDGLYPVQKDDVYLCVSLGAPYQQYCYKLVAAVIGLL
ncbi:MAG: hypothetical protein AB1696_03085 [Planctomycetota bacterium]